MLTLPAVSAGFSPPEGIFAFATFLATGERLFENIVSVPLRGFLLLLLAGPHRRNEVGGEKGFSPPEGIFAFATGGRVGVAEVGERFQSP